MIVAAPDKETECGTELDAGPRERRLQRWCVVTRTVQPVAELIRFVIAPDGEVVPDLKRRLPGRGVWVTATRAALEDAVKRKAFARGFKCDVRTPPDLAPRTEQLLEAAALDALSIAGKAGLVAAGFTRVESALAHDDVVALLHAGEAAADGIRKLDSAVRRLRPGRPLAVVGGLTGADLDLALGRPNVVHAALLAGPAADTFLARLRRLQRFRTGTAAFDEAPVAGKSAAN
jgi:hypothetical protein